MIKRSTQCRVVGTLLPVPETSAPGAEEKKGQCPPSPVGVGGGGGEPSMTCAIIEQVRTTASSRWVYIRTDCALTRGK